MSERRIRYDGEIHRCPNCGSTLPSFTTKCPICDIELRGVETVYSVAELTARLDSVERRRGIIDDKTILEREIWIIENFPIPNAKEDILEFLVLAASHIDISKANAENDKLMQAWKKKFEQAYYKAKLTFGDSPDFQRIEDIYKNELIKPKKKRSIKFLLPFLISILFLGCIGIGLGMLNLTTAKVSLSDEDLLGEQYDDVVTMFQSLGFTNIETKELPNATKENGEVVSVSINGDTDFSAWDRFPYEAKIVVSYRVVTPITLTVSTEDLIGQNYHDATAILNMLGFANVQKMEWKDSNTDEGKENDEVEKVIINGLSTFSAGESFNSNATIVVYYRVITSAKLDFSYSDVIQKNKGTKYKTVKEMFKSLGFTNVRCEEGKEDKWLNGFDKNDVYKIEINGISNHFYKDDRFALNSQIIIYYYI